MHPSRVVTLPPSGDLGYTSEALDQAKKGATAEAAPSMQKVSLQTKVSELQFFRGRGCEGCDRTGLKGRQGLYEVMAMTPKVRKMILERNGADAIKDAAVADGMLTLRMDGILKAIKGITTIEQVIRETAA